MHFSKMNPKSAIYKITNIIEKPRDGGKKYHPITTRTTTTATNSFICMTINTYGPTKLGMQLTRELRNSKFQQLNINQSAISLRTQKCSKK